MAGAPSESAKQPSVGLEEKVFPSGKSYTVDAVNKAFSEIKFEASLAQVLFQALWEELLSEYDAGEVPMPKVQVGMDKCFRVADEFRKKINLVEFEKRERYDKEAREKYTKNGKTLLHLPDAGIVQPHVPGGYIQGLEQ